MSGSDAMQNIGSAIGGGPTSKQVLSNMQYLQGPDKSNYQIGGLNQYGQQTQALASGAQGADAAFQQNASGLGSYNNTLAGQGGAQQQSAFNALQKMANGQGPSLAKANLQAGLNTTNAALQSSALSGANGAGAGNAQRNLLGAQVAAANNAQQQAQTASVAEQMGATNQLASAADSIRSANLQQAAAAAGAGSALRGQNLQSTQGSQATQLNALNSGMAAQQAQTQNNMAMDAANQQLGMEKSQLGQAATNAGAAAGGAVGKLGVDLLKSGVQGAAGALTMGMSDERQKTGVKQDYGFAGKLAQSLARMSPKPSTPTESLGNSLGQLAGNAIGQKIAMGRAEDAQADALAKWRANPGAGQAAAQPIAVDPPPQPIDPQQTLSDERQKTNTTQDFMDHLEPKKFEYKNPDMPGATHGQVHGVMAQDMEKSQLGDNMVHDTPIGKMFDTTKAVSAALNGIATLNQRLDEFEKKRGAKA